MVDDHHHFHFFHNKEVDALYLTLALIAFANTLINVFVPIYLWELGYPMWQIVAYYAVLSGYFMIFTTLLLPAFRSVSNKMLMFLSIPMLIVYYVGLDRLADLPVLYFILPGLVALNMLFFNTGYHIGFTAAVDDGKVGREVGMRYSIQLVSQFAAPFVGGFLITVFGFGNAFFVGSVILLLAVIPLFFFPKRTLSKRLHFRGLAKYLENKELRPFNLSGVGFASEKIIGITIWPIFVFLVLGNVESLGIVISVGLLIGALLTFLIGRMADAGQRRKALTWSAVIMGVVWFIRPFLFLPFEVIGSHVVGKSASSSALVSWSSQYYKIARVVKHTSLFILSREFLYHLSRFSVLAVLAVFAFILPLSAFFALSFILAGLFALMYLFANKEKRTKDLKI